MARRPSLRAVSTATVHTYYVKLIHCPECGRTLRPTGGSETDPLFHCQRCRHTWHWNQPSVTRIVIKKMRARSDESEFRPLSRHR